MAQITRRKSIGNKQFDVIKALYTLNFGQRAVVLKKADEKLIKLLCDCAHNVLRGNVPLSVNCKKKLRKYVSFLRTLATKPQSLSSKRLLLLKHQSCIPLLLAPIIKLWSTQKR